MGDGAGVLLELGAGSLLELGAGSLLEEAALVALLDPGRLFASRVVASAQKAISRPTCSEAC